jgi:hypothetical protein
VGGVAGQHILRFLELLAWLRCMVGGNGGPGANIPDVIDLASQGCQVPKCPPLDPQGRRQQPPVGPFWWRRFGSVPLSVGNWEESWVRDSPSRRDGPVYVLIPESPHQRRCRPTKLALHAGEHLHWNSILAGALIHLVSRAKKAVRTLLRSCYPG